MRTDRQPGAGDRGFEATGRCLRWAVKLERPQEGKRDQDFCRS